MTDRKIPKGFEALAAILAERRAQPPIIYDSIREACDELGPGIEPRHIRQDIYAGRVTAKKKPGSRIWTEIAIPYPWWYGSPKQRRKRKNQERRERRAAQMKERTERAIKRRASRRGRARSR